MTSLQRIQAVIDGNKPDRTPFSFWYHFAADQVSGPAAVKAHLDHLEKYGLDFLKVMNDNPYPHDGLISRPGELSDLAPLRGEEGGFGLQLELISQLRRRVGGDVPLITTIFNAWAILRALIKPPASHQPPNLNAAADLPSQWIRQAAGTDRAAVAGALGAIGQNLARFAALCLQAGADGIFLSVRDDWVDLQAGGGQGGLYDQLVRPTDLQVLFSAGRAKLNILHVCGKAMNFGAFAQYPVAIINWADCAAGPSIGQVKDWLKPAICGGVDNLTTLPRGSSGDVAHQVADALSQAGDRPIIIAPGARLIRPSCRRKICEPSPKASGVADGRPAALRRGYLEFFTPAGRSSLRISVTTEDCSVTRSPV